MIIAMAIATTDNPAMPQKPGQSNYLKAWREYRGYSQEDVERETGISQGSLSKLETGRSRYNRDNLELLANLYLCNPADLIGRDPEQSQSIVELWNMLPPQERQTAERLLRTLAEPTEQFAGKPTDER